MDERSGKEVFPADPRIRTTSITASRLSKRPLSPPVQQARNSVPTSLIAGSCAGMCSTIIMYPMDVVRTKMQIATVGGPLHIARHTVAHGGVRALYTGIALPLSAQAVYKATVFTVNNVMQNLILDYRTMNHNHKMGTASSTGPVLLTLGDRFWCGLVGGTVNATVFVTPVEFVRNQLIAQHSKLASATMTETRFRGSWDVVRQTVQKQGVFSLWRGNSWAMGRDGIGCGLYFYTIAWAQQRLTPPGEKTSLGATVVSGALAGLAFWTTALPMDSIKTWIQSADVGLAAVSPKDAIAKIYSERGATGVFLRLTRGWQVAFGRGIPSSAITITTYSLVYNHLQQAEAA